MFSEIPLDVADEDVAKIITAYVINHLRPASKETFFVELRDRTADGFSHTAVETALARAIVNEFVLDSIEHLFESDISTG